MPDRAPSVVRSGITLRSLSRQTRVRTGADPDRREPPPTAVLNQERNTRHQRRPITMPAIIALVLPPSSPWPSSASSCTSCSPPGCWWRPSPSWPGSSSGPAAPASSQGQPGPSPWPAASRSASAGPIPSYELSTVCSGRTRPRHDTPEQVGPVDQDHPACHPVGRRWLAEELLQVGRRVPAVGVGDRERGVVPGRRHTTARSSPSRARRCSGRVPGTGQPRGSGPGCPTAA